MREDKGEKIGEEREERRKMREDKGEKIGEEREERR